ncbi:uncharacterized protein CDAR_501861 [Caerostris darwini]|uniref:Uncharacterized protein n=1 Tax=Caerostris darwini TaxID=1538125 RepID=A0AAV4TNP7_9ARAC|nr:uncharacterized protein CDAR_501861 [Caerostris darwini]
MGSWAWPAKWDKKQQQQNNNKHIHLKFHNIKATKVNCSAFGEFVTCKYLHVSQDCGHDAAIFLQQHLDRISSPLIHEHCAHYTYASDACAPTSPASTPTPMLHLHRCSSLIFLIMWILLHWVTCLLTPPRIIT